MDHVNIRWVQRFKNYRRALAQLTKFMERDALNELEEQGLIKAFEYNFELSWKVVKDLLEYQGITGLIGSRDAFREGFKQGLLGDEAMANIWMGMIKSRNLTSHTYDEEMSQKLIAVIINDYFHAFVALQIRLEALLEDED